MRIEDLRPQTEYRFEAGFAQPYSIRVLAGHVELHGVELASNQAYSFSGVKGALFTWQGCRLEITGDAESEYAAEETEYAVEWLNVHGMLETAREMASAQDGGPRVLIVGPDHAGKSSLMQSVAAWGVKAGRTPTVLNLDSREGLLAPPGTLSAATVGSQFDVEAGYGIAPISGPTITPIKTPLIYSFPYASPAERPDTYKSLITRMALSVTNRLEEDASAKRSGLLIDTPGSLNDPKSNYDLIAHIVSEFSITLILSLGSERLYNDLNRRFNATKSGDEAIPVLRITKPGGAVETDSTYLKQIRTRQIRQYFFGTAKEALNPHSHTLNFSELSIYRARLSVLDSANTISYAANDDDDDIPYASSATRSRQGLDKVEPSVALTASLLAIKFCPGNAEETAVRDSAVMGFLYVAEVDETRQKVRFLAPHPQRWGDRALVWGVWPEAVADILT